MFANTLKSKYYWARRDWLFLITLKPQVVFYKADCLLAKDVAAFEAVYVQAFRVVELVIPYKYPDSPER